MAKLALLGGTPARSTPLPYARQTVEADDIAAVTDALGGGWITQGPTIARFERALAERAGVRHAVAVANGTAALHAACWAASLGPGDEAITTPLTFAATANAVVYQGARPVFADIDGATLNVDPDAVKRAATGRTRAVLPVDLAERLRTMRHHGIRYADPARPWRYEIPEPGNNYRLTDFQSALGLSQLAKLDRFWERRDQLARRYRERLQDSPFLEVPALPEG